MLRLSYTEECAQSIKKGRSLSVFVWGELLYAMLYVSQNKVDEPKWCNNTEPKTTSGFI